MRNGEKKARSQRAEIWHRFKKNKPALIGMTVLATIVTLAVMADFIADYQSVTINQDIANRLQSPSVENLMGTDMLGRDIFARVIHGGRISLIIGFTSTIFSMLAGVIIGAISGYFGGRTDYIIMRIMDVFLAIPTLLLCIAIVAVLGPGVVNLILAATVSLTPGFSRLVRSSVLTLSTTEFVEAAKAVGSSHFRIISKHIVPNAIGPIIVQATMNVALVIIATSGLSFIGLGIKPPAPEWGAMLAEGQEYMRHAPNGVVFPGLAIVITALSINLVGDGLRDALDPRLKGKI